MFACLVSLPSSQLSQPASPLSQPTSPLFQPASQPALLALASSFSPLVEDTAPGVVVFSIVGLSKLIGTVDQIASVIARMGAEARIQANLAISADPDTAFIAARYKGGGLHIIPPGREAERLGTLPLHVLGEFIADDSLRILDTLDRWGIKTLGELAALPELGFLARFGESGERLLRLARGETQRTLRVRPAPETYERRAELEHPLALLEPLLFLLSSMLQELMEALARQGLATNRVRLGLRLVKHAPHERTLEFPVPIRDPQVLLKQLQFDLEAHPPQAAILGVAVHLNPVEPRSLQHGLFLPQAPAPEKLSLTLARLTALVGEGNAGSPELLDMHRPDSFRMQVFSSEKATDHHPSQTPHPRVAVCPAFPQPGGSFRFAFRYARPAPRAAVRLEAERPVTVQFQSSLQTYPEKRQVLASAGPWRASGEWWTASPWDREEWDVELSDGGLYRVFRTSREWFLEGVYD